MIGRLLTWWRSAPPAPPAPASLPRAATARARPDVAAASGSQAATTPGWLIARRPLIDRHGAIAGWDLQLAERASERLNRRDSPRVLREAYWFALAQAARETSDQGRAVLLGCSSAALADSGFIERLPGQTILRLQRGQGEDLAACNAGWRDTWHKHRLLVAAPPDEAAGADFVLVDAAEGAIETGPPAAEAEAAQRIVMNLRTYEEVGRVVRQGIRLCCGNFAVAARRPEQRNVAQPAIQAAQVLSAVISGLPPKEIAERFKADPALAHRLLRATRSAAFALNRPLESLLEAVMVLGTRELYRWLSVMLMSADQSSAIASALYETALTRARLLERLAESGTRRDPPEQLFVTGAFSLLDLLLNVPLEVALALTPLPTAATEALIGESGPWRPYLSIALAFESGAPEPLQAACAALRIDIETVCRLEAEARSWAAATVQALHEAPARRQGA